MGITSSVARPRELVTSGPTQADLDRILAENAELRRRLLEQ